MKDKFHTLVQILTYSMAAFGFGMLCAYILVSTSNTRSYIPMAAITQLLCYVLGITIAISLFLSDLIFSSLSEVKRIACFFSSLYVMGMGFFQCFAPIGPFDRVSHFFGFSIWIIWMSFMCLCVWFIYQRSWNQKYNAHLTSYQKKLADQDSL